MDRHSLITKYDQALPRYTSYPTVPFWQKEVPAEESWKRAVSDAWISGGRRLSLYIHLPFCESLCTYCACNTRITKNHAVEEPYILHLLNEWSQYLDIIGETPVINELHLGGGTPTFFTPEHLEELIEAIRGTAQILPGANLSFEAHPANTTSAHLEALHRQGFNRLSLGVQDFNPEVQRLINRRQTEAQLRAVTTLARIIGYTSINFDLVYGLPKQTLSSVIDTIQKTIDIRPDRIAFYSYAHVPWMRPGQRAYTEADLPQGEAKRELYECGREFLEQAGYVEIGLDHFALPGDELMQAAADGKLNRNFMGYTEKESPLLIGLGASAISDAGTMFVQNLKEVEAWSAAVDAGKIPFFRGHEMSRSDLVLRRHIHNIMCKGKTSWQNEEEQCEEMDQALKNLLPLQQDGLVEIHPFSVEVTELGKAFLRNIGACFDAKLHQANQQQSVFSRTA